MMVRFKGGLVVLFLLPILCSLAAAQQASSWEGVFSDTLPVPIGKALPNSVSNPSADYFVLKDRQKYVGLPAYLPGVEYDSITFSIVSPPQNGHFLGSPPNLVYVPNTGFVGTDSFVYLATAGASAIRRTMTISVDTQFVAPIGVPTPTFGINDSHTMYAGRVFNFGGRLGLYRDAGNGPYSHYIDFDTGSDLYNAYGTSDRPRKTIPSSLPPGSVVELHGTLTNPPLQRLFIRGAGTAQAPIFIRGASPSNKAVLRRPVSIQSNYVICENLEFDCRDFGLGTSGANWFWVTNTDAPAPFVTFSNVCLRHSLIHDQPTMDLGENPSGIVAGVQHFDQALNDPNLLVQNIVAYDVEIRNFATWNNFSGVDDYSACLYTANSVNTWALDCHFHHMRGPAVGLSRLGGLSNHAPARNSYVSRNYIHHCKETALDLKNAVDCIFSWNTCHTFRKCESYTGYAVSLLDDDQTTNWPGADNIWILFNTIYDSENGINHELRNWSAMPSGKHSRSYIVGNLIFGIRYALGNPYTDGVAIHKGQLGESRIIGNTIYNCDQGIWLGYAGLTDPAHTTQVVRNNSIVSLTERYRGLTGLDAMHIYLTPQSIEPYTTIDHNLHYENVGRVHFTFTAAGQRNVEYYSVTDLFASTGFDGQSIQVDPLFRDPGGLNFHLSANTPVASSGSGDDAYNLFPGLFGSSINFYLDGTPRPVIQCAIGALPRTAK